MKSIIKKTYRKAIDTKRAVEFPYAPYNKKNNCLFIHIPKVAGTSITEALGGSNARRNHLPWYVYFTANKSFFEKSFKFSFVRNPWDRALSAYKYLSSGGNQKTDLKTAEKLLQFDGFDDFVVNGLGKGDFRNHLLFIPQSEFIVNGDQEIVVDFLGRFENIDEDFPKILDRIGIKKDLEKKNSSTRSVSYKNYYNDNRSIEIISELYAQDLKMFSYEY